MKYFLSITIVLFLFNCKEQPTETLSAQTIIDKSIEISGGAIIGSSAITFDFRDKQYKAIRNGNTFVLEREFIDSKSKNLDTVTTVRDVITNKGFQRFVNNFPIATIDTMSVKYTASVNSVHYFSVLPYGLNDKAVNKILLEDVLIKSKNYHTVKVTFDQDGGGEDFEDVFYYWINSETFKVEYLAYSYNESDGKGMRFRASYNERYVKGIRFVDYDNYKPESATVALVDLPQLFEIEQLKLLSKIELENVDVKLN